MLFRKSHFKRLRCRCRSRVDTTRSFGLSGISTQVFVRYLQTLPFFSIATLKYIKCRHPKNRGNVSSTLINESLYVIQVECPRRSDSVRFPLRRDDLQHGDHRRLESHGDDEREEVRYHCQTQEQDKLGNNSDIILSLLLSIG